VLKSDRQLVLALLTDDGPSAYSLPPLSAIFLAEALGDAARRPAGPKFRCLRCGQGAGSRRPAAPDCILTPPPGNQCRIRRHRCSTTLMAQSSSLYLHRGNNVCGA
jgi:hypothetical protein